MKGAFLILMAFSIVGCSSSIKSMFAEKDSQEAEKVEKDHKIDEKFKTVEQPKKKKKVVRKKKRSKKRVAKKVKKEVIPKEEIKRFQALDENSKKVWAKFKPSFESEEDIVIKIYFFGLTVGHLKMSVKPMVKVGDRPAYHFSARMRSAKYYSYFYSLDDTVDSYLDVEKNRPLKYLALQRESKQQVDDLQLFDLEKRKTYVWYNRIKKDRNKKFEREAYTPEYFQDFLSAFYFTRGLPMVKGNKYVFPVVSRAKVYTFHMEVVGQEKVRVNRKTYLGYKLKAYSLTKDKKQKKGEVFFWYSTDPSRKLLKFSAKIKIGEVRGELVEYKSGNKLISSNIAHKKL